MIKWFLPALITFLSSAINCQTSEEDRIFRLFNEGVAYSLDAADLLANGKEEKGEKFYEKAIEKFKDVLEINPEHQGAVSALGFSFYELSNYEEALIWFAKAIKIDPSSAIDHQFLGLSQINKGNVEEGELNLERALDLDPSEELRSSIVENLVYIGNLAFSYGESYLEEGDEKKGNGYRAFGIRVLLSAFEFSKKDEKIKKTIEDYTAKINDAALSTWIEEKLNK